jgi:hypothetical protein
MHVVQNYKGHSEMIWTHLICSNFITFNLNTKQLPAQNIALLGYTLLPSPWELHNGFTEQFLRGVTIPLTDNRLCGFLVTVELCTQLNTVLCADAFSPQTADD